MAPPTPPPARIVLETERLLFRGHEEADLGAYCEMMADPEFRRLSGRPLSREEAEKSFRSIVIGQESWLEPKPMGLLATIFKPEGRYIGRCGVYPNRGDDNEVIPGEGVLAFYLARPYWGRGLATEAGRAFLQFGFGELGLSRIVAGANVTNVASNRVLRRLGFVWTYTGEGGGSRYHDYELRNPLTEARQEAG
jgi:ribosomal-protein-alanine N-acetyltransferase